MSDNEKNNNPAVGLDIGTSRIVRAKRNNDDYDIRSQLNAFVDIPFSKMTEKALEKEGVPYARHNGSLTVHGTESEKFADLLGLETRRPMRGGLLNPSEVGGPDVIGKILDSLLGEKDGKGRLLMYSIPAAPLDSASDLTYHEAALKEILEGRGYKVSSIDEGLAVVYAELEDSNYTGIGVSCGGGLCNVCLSYLSVPVLSFCVQKAGDFIDDSAASVTGELATRIRIEKESGFHFNGGYSSKVHQALNVYYNDMIKSVIDGLAQAIDTTSSLPKLSRPLPLVLSGGTAMPAGFADKFELALADSDLPLEISDVKLASDPLNTTAKGALIAALAEA